MKPYIKVALAIVFIIAVGGILVGLHYYFLKHSDLAKTKPDFVLTASSLQKEFADDEKGSSKKYINKVIEVSGTVGSVTRADSSNLNISLKTGSDISSVICTFPVNEETLKFKGGNEITLRGECSGFLMDVLLNNCALIVKSK